MFSYVCSLYLSFCAVLSHVWLFATTWTVAPKAPLVHGIFHSKILEWVTISFLQGSSRPKDWTPVFYISFLADGFFTTESPLASNFSLKSRPSWTIKKISPEVAFVLWGQNCPQLKNHCIQQSYNSLKCVRVKVAQSCLTLCDPMDYTVHGILQAKILEWVAISFARGSSQPRDRSQISHIAGEFFISWATRV